MILLRHPGEYKIVKNTIGQLFRLDPAKECPKGYEEVQHFEHKYGNVKTPIYKTNGRLDERLWSLKRIR